MKYPRWKMKDGKTISIHKMTDSHLLNAIRMLERLHSKNISAGYSMLGFLQGEQATLDVERTLDVAEDEGPGYSYPIYDDLVIEFEARGASHE